KVGGDAVRLPNAGDVRYAAGRVLDAATSMFLPGTRWGTSLFRILYGHNFTGRRADMGFLYDTQLGASNLPGGRDRLVFAPYGRPPTAPDTFDGGLELSDSPGSLRGRVIAYGSGGRRVDTGSQIRVSALGSSKLHRIRMQGG